MQTSLDDVDTIVGSYSKRTNSDVDNVHNNLDNDSAHNQNLVFDGQSLAIETPEFEKESKEKSVKEILLETRSTEKKENSSSEELHCISLKIGQLREKIMITIEEIR